MVKDYFTIMAVLIVIRGLFIPIYIFISKRTKLKNKNSDFILNKWFNSYNSNTWRIFWASMLWLIVFFFQYIRAFVIVGLESLTFL